MKNHFIVKKVAGAESAAEVLVKARQKKQLTLEEAEKNLKIQKKYLDYLEKGSYHKLPADVYVVGFIKSYAKYLGLDEKRVTELYKRERNILENIKKKQGGVKKLTSYKKPNIIVTPRLIKIGSLVLLVLVLLFYLWYQISGLSVAPKLVVSEPSSDKTITENTVGVVGQTKPGANVEINGQSVYINSEGEFRESVGLQEGLNVIKITAVNKLNKKSVVERRVLVEKAEE